MTDLAAAFERVFELAEKGRYSTSPNPRVGAVVVAPGGEIVGEGWHERAGGPHAEVVALAEAGSRARGATVVLNLEPCAHEGRTPPCAGALAAAGVAPTAGDADGEAATLIDLVTPDAATEYWLGYRNFYVITRYNRSSFYAMAVFQLGEALRAARHP